MEVALLTTQNLHLVQFDHENTVQTHQGTKTKNLCACMLTLTVLVTTIDALGHFETR